MQNKIIASLEFPQGSGDHLGVFLFSRAGRLAEGHEVRATEEVFVVGGRAVGLEDADGVAGGEDGKIGFLQGGRGASFEGGGGGCREGAGKVGEGNLGIWAVGDEPRPLEAADEAIHCVLVAVMAL